MSGHEHERLSAYLDGELPPEERAAVEAHLAACPDCASFLAELRAVDDAAASLPAEAPEGYFEGFPARVLARLEPRRPVEKPWRPPAWTWAAAAVLLLAVVTPLTLRSVRHEPGGAPPAVAAPPWRRHLRPCRRRPPMSARDRSPRPARRPLPCPRAPHGRRLPRPRSKRPRLVSRASEAKRESNSAPATAAPPPSPASSLEARPDTLQEGAVAAESVARGGQGERRRAATAETSVAPQPAAPAAGFAAGLADERDPDLAFRSLDTERPPRTAGEWRRLRDEWTAFVAANPAHPRADEARVRAIEAGYAAWRTTGNADDEAAFRREAQAYLERSDALQKERVRRLLPRDPPRP